MLLKQTSSFSKQKKKLPAKQIYLLDDVIKTILDDPSIGDQKSGDLSMIYVYKFKMAHQLYLLAYQYSSDCLILHALAPHENFYRDLKRTLRG